MERLGARGLAIAASAIALLVAGGEASAAPARVASVELRLPPGEDARALADLVAVSPGERLSSRGLRRTAQRLFQTGRFRNVVIRAVPVSGEPGEQPGVEVIEGADRSVAGNAAEAGPAHERGGAEIGEPVGDRAPEGGPAAGSGQEEERCHRAH